MKFNMSLNSNSSIVKINNQSFLNSSKLSLTSLSISDSEKDYNFKEKTTNLESVPTSPILNRMCLSPIKYKFYLF